MLSAAQDILNKQYNNTGVLLLADVLPTLIIKSTAPLFLHHVPYSAFIASLQSEKTQNHSRNTQIEWMYYIELALASLTLICFSCFCSIHRHVISGWSSGTGAAGLFASLSYLGLTQAHISPENTLLIMLVVPALMALISDGNFKTLSTKCHICLVISKNFTIHNCASPPRYQALYQVGVFISRSSLRIIHIRKTWILALLQCVNAVFIFFAAFYRFVPSIFIIFPIIVYEGLLGGASYVNTFNNIRKEVKENHCEFALGVTSVADSIGITLAGAIAIPVHNAICEQ
uniref:Battenin n=1 Tax=Eptatretus burgeri TaxID=7764 RepID=A0A8C4R478_EPTBU